MGGKEREGPLAGNLVAAVEELVLGGFADAGAAVKTSRLGELERDVLIEPDTVVVAALDHEGSRGNERGHLRVVEGVAQVELVHLVLVREHVAAAPVERDVLPDPFVEVAGADDRAI